MFVMGASLSTNCKIPPDLSNIREKVNGVTISNSFLLPAEYMSPYIPQTPNRTKITCPGTLSISGGVQNRSICPWDTKVVKDSRLFPSVRLEAVCRCRDCIGADGMHNCQMVYSKMVFLQQTSRCVGGFYVYEPIIKYVQTGCVCAKKIIL